ncbi:MAG: Brp/Blh family beta-carotene 15,15'-dioxygenase [Halobacteriaceae archaeon]
MGRRERLLSGQDATERMVAASRAVFVGLIAVFGVAALVGATPPLEVQSLVYLALMVGISLPHGGFEHVANLRGRGESFQVRYLGAYLLLVAASAGLFVVAPVAGLAVALAVTALKGGFGGVRVLETTADADHLDGLRVLGALVRGGAVVVVPLVYHPGIYYMVASYMVGLFDSGALAAVRWAFELPARTALSGGYHLAAFAYLGAGLARADSLSGWAADARETLLLIAYFAVVPPIVAIGVYFPFWYASRQVARLTAAGRGDLGAALWRVARGAPLPWLGALAVLVGVWLLVPNPPASAVGWAALYSVFVAVIAVPHVVVGSWLDRRQGIWSAA